MKYTLIELVQRILESLDGDEVNSIADTTESLAVANIIKECYFEIISSIEPRESQGLFHLTASGDSLLPTVMYLPDHVSNIQLLKYNIGDTVTDTNFRDLCYMDVADFLRYTSLDLDQPWVGTQAVTLDGEIFNFKFRNDQSPHYWTSPDDRTLIFDAYDSSYEATLTSSRTYGVGGLIPTFSMTDTHVPDLDARQFQLLLNAAKSQASVEIKQTVNEAAARKERTHRILAYKTNNNTDPRSQVKKRKGYGR